MNQGKPVFSDSYLGLELYQVQSQQAVGPDKHTLKVAFDYGGAGGARGAGGKASLFIDGQKVGEGKIFRCKPTRSLLNDTADTGVDTGTSVDPAHGEGDKNACTGRLKRVNVRVR